MVFFSMVNLFSTVSSNSITQATLTLKAKLPQSSLLFIFVGLYRACHFIFTLLEAIFKLYRNECCFVSYWVLGDQARSILIQSGLSQGILAQIWYVLC